MKNKKALFVIFIIVVLAQLYVPAQMILNQESIIDTGTLFKFKTIPFDPIDPLRGKYIHLRFEEDTFNITNKKEWTRYQEVFVVIENDSEGFAKIVNIVKEKPDSNLDFLKANIDFVNKEHIRIEYPFNRFYMEESKAKEAEDLYQQNSNNHIQGAYALVYVKDGESVLKDVMIDGKSIKDVVLENRK